MIQQLYAAIPPKLNEQIRINRSHWSQGAKAKKQHTSEIALIARCDGLKPFPGKVWIDFEWQVKTLQNDPDNVAAAAKFIMDGLVDAGVIQKDSLAIIQSPVIHRYTKGKDQVIVTLSDRPIWQLTPIAQEEAA